MATQESPSIEAAQPGQGVTAGIDPRPPLATVRNTATKLNTQQTPIRHQSKEAPSDPGGQ